MALGLTTDDIMAIEDFTDTLKKKHSPFDVTKMKTEVEKDELKVRALQLAEESEKYQKDMERIRQTNAELNLKIRELDSENKKLEQGLKEVLKSVKDTNINKSGRCILFCVLQFPIVVVNFYTRKYCGLREGTIHFR